MSVLAVGSSGPGVTALQQKLKEEGFDPGLLDGEFGLGTEAAVIAFQKSEGLMPDGIVGPRTQAALKLIEAPAPGTPSAPAVPGALDITGAVTVAEVSKMCPGAPLGNIKANLPPILEALRVLSLGDKSMVLMAIATIRAETARFEPISEFKSRFNTSPHGHPFDLYDSRKDLGNRGPPDGANFKGCGFVQLTGRFNYEKLDRELGLGGSLVSNPDSANDQTIAAKILARFLKDKEAPIRTALQLGNLKKSTQAGEWRNAWLRGVRGSFQHWREDRSLSVRKHLCSDRVRRRKSYILGNLRVPLTIDHPRLFNARLFAAVVVVTFPSAGQAASSQCTDTESVLFTCRIGKNVISVCASQLSADAGLVQYRFGPEGAPKIRFPATAQDWRTRARAGMLTYAGGGGAYVAFTNASYRYVVYTAIGRGWGEKSGVAVEKNGKLVSNLPCTQDPVSELGPDLFSKGGFPSDPAGFNLP